MDNITKSYFENLEAKDKNLQLEAFQHIIEATKYEVDWAYEVWDQLNAWLADPDNHRRARAGQILAGLAISDPDKRMLNDFPMGSNKGSEVCHRPAYVAVDLEGRIGGGRTKGNGASVFR